MLGEDDGNVFGVLQQDTTTRLNVIVYRERIGAIIDPAAGCACTVDTYAPGAVSSFGRATGEPWIWLNFCASPMMKTTVPSYGS